MRFLSRTKALAELRRIRQEFRTHISANFEHRAKSCAECQTPGACCLDAHFVNVRISRLEADAIRNVIDGLDASRRERVCERIETTRVVGESYACPLFEPGTRCIVHAQAKPLACIAHACYENQQDLPPDHLLSDAESLVDDLNVRAFGSCLPRQPIPIALRRGGAA